MINSIYAYMSLNDQEALNKNILLYDALYLFYLNIYRVHKQNDTVTKGFFLFFLFNLYLNSVIEFYIYIC
jgi:hypothetical protein